MTYDDDFIRLPDGRNTPCVANAIEWPPPDRLYHGPFGMRAARDGDPPRHVLVKVRQSQITDEQRDAMTHVCRGAEYSYDSGVTA